MQRHPYQWFDRRDLRDRPPTKLPYPQFIDAKPRRSGTTALLGPQRPRPDTSHIPLSELLGSALGVPEELPEPPEEEMEPEASASPEELAAFQEWEAKVQGHSAEAGESADPFRPRGLCVNPKRAYREQIAHEQRLLGKLKTTVGEEVYDHLVTTQKTHAAICYWLLSETPARGARALAEAIATELGRPDLRWRILREVRKIK